MSEAADPLHDGNMPFAAWLTSNSLRKRLHVFESLLSVSVSERGLFAGFPPKGQDMVC